MMKMPSPSFSNSPFVAVVVLLFVTVHAVVVRAAVTGIGPLPYLSAADSPFVGDPSLVTQIEDFEDGLLNVPGIVNVPITSSPSVPPIGDGIGIVVGPGGETDSVDGDDGSIDGSGTAGHSLRSNYLLINFQIHQHFIDFNFLPDSHGNYPTAFGFVWTDGQAGTRVTLYGVEVNSSSAFFTGSILSLGDATFTGSTAEDRFFGVRSSVGIKSLGILSRYDDDNPPGLLYFEMDHLQISYPAVPEPTSLVQAALAAVVTFYVTSRRSSAARRAM